MEKNQSTIKGASLLPIGELFKKSFDVYQQKIWLLFRTVAFGLLGCLILLPFGLTALVMSITSIRSKHISPSLILVDVLLILVGLFFCVLFGLWARVASFYAIKEPGIELKKFLSMAWPKIGSFFWVSLLVGLATAAGFILFIVPGIIFSVWFVFSFYVLIFEDKRGVEALKQSRELVRGNWWPIFGRMLIMMAITILVSWIKGFGTILNMFFVSPFFMVYMMLLYEDLKRIKK